jgi:hypothetical protein
MTSETAASNRCSSCYGTGELVTESGAVDCPDCMGVGKAPRGEVIEWRLRDIERAASEKPSESAADIRWLVFELRRHREALVRIFTRCQDIDDSALSTELRHLANEALDLYPVERGNAS